MARVRIDLEVDAHGAARVVALPGDWLPLPSLPLPSLPSRVPLHEPRGRIAITVAVAVRDRARES